MRTSSERRALRALAGAALAIGLAAAPVSADHTFGTLTCPGHGTWAVEAASIEPLPLFETPVPWSGLFLLEGTAGVYRAFSIDTPSWDTATAAASRNPNAIVACTLTSSGYNFEAPWHLLGFLTR